ncbi:MAG TPA: RnfABCDGE type electron transport complex subunit D, partial [Verrucomicrobiae bacterium]
MTRSHWLRADPRIYQIAALGSLLLYGGLWLHFDISLAQAAATLATVLVTQYLCTRLAKLPAFDPRSALISGLSLCLLLRTNSLWWVTAAAAATIASKFLLRWRGKHIFNPTNFGLVLMMLCTGGQVWVSPGQWGAVAFFGFLMACAGGLIINRAGRTDVTVAFLGFYLALIFGRSLWLGEPMSIPLHRLQNGALLLFAFFMISDPKTTPDSRAGRILLAALVAWGAAFVQFKLFRTNGMLWSLAAGSLAVPLIDWLLPGGRYQWRRPGLAENFKPPTSTKKGTVYEP